MKQPRGRDGGFTLVELLIVIVILGLLATVTVLAVSGITDKGKTSACASDYRTVAGAEEAYSAERAVYGTMAEIVSAGRLHSTSILFAVAVNPAGDAYTLTGVGDCTGWLP